jgi:hypothetical protein
MSTTAAWLVLIVGFVLPLLHVGLSPSAGPWRVPKDARCPFSPRVGWLVIVLFLGPLGWLMFMSKRRRPPAA